jgi:hypothetical protein
MSKRQGMVLPEELGKLKKLVCIVGCAGKSKSKMN